MLSHTGSDLGTLIRQEICLPHLGPAAMASSTILSNMRVWHSLPVPRCSLAPVRLLSSPFTRHPHGKRQIHLPWYSSRRCRLVAMASSAVSPTGTAPPAALGSEVKKVLVPIGKGTEEMEAVIIIDILRRAAADVSAASVEDELQIVASRNVKLEADTLISTCEGQTYDLVVLPGGMPGSERLRDNKLLRKITETPAQQNRLS